MNDDRLWNQLFVKLSKSNWDAMLRFAYSLTRSQADAEDLMQNALVKGMRFFPRFAAANLQANNAADAERAFEDSGARAHLKNWLFKITKNTYLDDIAVKKPLSFQDEDYDLENLSAGNGIPFSSSNTTLDPNVTAKSQTLLLEEKQFFALALDDSWKSKVEELSARQRSVLFLAAEEYSYKEIASILDIPMGTVMSTLSRALQKLKKSQTEPEVE